MRALPFLALLFFSLGSLAADKSGVSPNTISLPKGPGSIEGLGESFQPTLNTGTAKYSVALAVPPGTAGQTPGLKLYYEGGGGNGPLGFGWSLPGANIQRRTDQGVPLYPGETPPTAGDDWSARYNNFINDSKEELVPTADGFYFCKNEGSFVRYQRTNDYWLATLPDGTRLEFGATAEGRIQDTNATPGRVFSWLLQRETDTHGNVIVYSYTNFPGHQNSNQVYLAEIRYGPGGPPWQNFHFVRFIYEERPDWFEDCRSGFAVRTGRRLARIDIGTQGPTLADHLQGDFNSDGLPDNLVRRYGLSYLDYAGLNSHWSLLAAVTRLGADGVSTLPPSTFGYTVCNPPDLLSAVSNVVLSLNEPSQLMNNTNVDLIDLNGDALPDILDTGAGGGVHRAFINLGEVDLGGAKAIRWTNAVPLAGDTRAASYTLAQSSVHLADLDGDGLADLISQPTASTFYHFRNSGNVSWGNRRTYQFQDVAPPIPFGNPDVRTGDLDFDKQIDIIQSPDASRYFVWLRLGPDRYSGRITRPNPSGALFSQTGVQIADFNGDRVPDVARVRQDSVVITAGFGYGRFSEPRNVALDAFLTSAQAQNARLTDITGDGMADLVIERASGSQLWYWINLGNYSFGPRKVINGLPVVDSSTVVRWADLNGNGSTDLIYAGGSGTNRLKTVELGLLLNCGPIPNVLTTISNGIGRATFIGYAPSTQFAARDAASGRPWTNALPFPVQVVSSITNLDSLGHSYRTEFRYHDAYYDPVEKQFRGFASAEQYDIGDPTAPTLVTRSQFDVGRDFEAMKGRLIRTSAETEDGRVFNESITSWQLPPRTLLTGTNGTNVSYAHPVAHRKRILELGQGTERVLESEMFFDNFGNQTTNIDYGIVEHGERRAFSDERVTVTEFAINTNRWLIRHPQRSELRDLDGAVISRTDSFYDDETFSGNNPGLVTIGNPTLTRSWISPSNSIAQIKSARTKFDSYGNPTLLLDPLAEASSGTLNLAKGHARELAYDARFHTFPTDETVHLGSGKEPLRFQARYDEGFGTALASVDFNGNETTYGYDAFARIVRIVKPYDSPAYPTAEYSYALGVPVPGGGTVNYVETRSRDKSEVRSPKSEMYLSARSFVDGLGRALMTKQEAGSVVPGGAPRVVVKGATLFNARLSASASLNPFYSALSGALEDQLAYESIESPEWRGEFQDNGQLVSLDLANAHKVSNRYDAALRAIQVTNPDGTFGRSVYEPLLTKSFDENDVDAASPHFDTPMVHYNDGLGRLIRVDEVVRLTDDGHPLPSVGRGAGGEGTAPVAWTTRYEYDLNDQLTKMTDSLGNVKLMAYDGLKRRVFMNDLDRGVMHWVFDDASNVRETTDAKGQRITFTYDGANRILAEDYHDEGLPFSRNFSFNPALPVTAANRPDVAYFYDTPAPNLDQGDGTTATATNVKGRLAYVWDLSGEEHTSCDARGRAGWTVKRIPDPALLSFPASGEKGRGEVVLVSYKTAVTYDSLDRITSHTYPDNDQVLYRYNDRSLLTDITGEQSGPLLHQIQYWPSDQQKELNYGNGVRTTYTHDSRLRLRRLLTVSQPASQNTQLLNYTYDFDNSANITTIHDQRPGSVVPAGDKRRNTQLFQYDSLYRLTRVQYSFALPGDAKRNDGEVSYRYDRIGNMLAQTSTIDHQENGLPIANLGEMSYGGAGGRVMRTGRAAQEPPGPHALTRITPPSTQNSQLITRNYPYDANGNMTDIDSLRCTWDFKDRLVFAEDAQMHAEYTYDYTDRRIIKRVKQIPSLSTFGGEGGGDVTSVLYSSSLFEMREHDAPVKYVWNGSARLARVIGPLSHRPLVQRLRIRSGWNLVSLAVSGPLNLLNVPAVQQAYRWDVTTKALIPVAGIGFFSSGDVVWIRASESVTLSVFGTYSDPLIRRILPGDHFIPCQGLRPFNFDRQLFGTATVWAYRMSRMQWFWQSAAALPRASDFPAVLPSGQAFFVRSDESFTLPPPDLALDIRYYHQDHLGSPAVLGDGLGRSIEESVKYPFGCSRYSYHPVALSEPYGFTQKEKDVESGLHYFEARFMASALARFSAVDSLVVSDPAKWITSPQMMNSYTYCTGRPTVCTDASGWEPVYGSGKDDARPVVVRREGQQEDDYTTISFGFGLGFSITIDRFNQSYFSLGGATPGMSIQGGSYVNVDVASPSKLSGALSGPSHSVSGSLSVLSASYSESEAPSGNTFPRALETGVAVGPPIGAYDGNTYQVNAVLDDPNPAPGPMEHSRPVFSTPAFSARAIPEQEKGKFNLPMIQVHGQRPSTLTIKEPIVIPKSETLVIQEPIVIDSN